MAGGALANAASVKRFYGEARAEPAEGGWQILLDDRPVRTPARAPLIVPAEALAEAIAEEWNAQPEEVDPRALPLTGIANAAIDRVAADPAVFAGTLASYADSDLLCYRAEAPERLAARQAELWDPILGWARRRFDLRFEIVRGVSHRPQPAGTVERLAAVVAGRGPFELAALSPLVTVSGSLLIALALAEGSIGLDQAWAAAALDELWQAEQWGEDPEAAKALAARRRDFESAARFLALL